MFFFSMLAMVACQETPAPVVETVAAPKPVPPEFDASLESDEAVAKWQTDTLALADVVIHPADPKALDAIEAAFKVTPAAIHAYVFPPVDPAVAAQAKEEVAYQAEQAARLVPKPVVPVTAAQAKELEASHERLEAGRAYAKLGDAEGAKRMIKALKADGEWNAAAAIAYAMGDKVELIADMEKMQKRGGWDDRMRDLIAGAIADNKVSLATELATHFGWNIDGGDWDDQLGASKDPKVVRMLLERQVAGWIADASSGCLDENKVVVCDAPVNPTEGYESMAPFAIEDDIAAYASRDHEGALALAKKLLGSRYSNVRGTANDAFYKLVRTDASLKVQYLGKVRLSGKGGTGPWLCCGEGTYDPTPTPWSPTVSFQDLVAIKKSGDTDLLSARADALGYAEGYWYGQECVSVSWLDKRGKCAQQAGIEDVAFARYLLGLPGGSASVVDPVSNGEISNADLIRVWKELGLPVPPAGLTAEKLAETVAAATALSQDKYDVEAVVTLRTVLAADAQELSYADSWSRTETYAVFLKIAKNDTTDARKLVSETVASQRKSIADTLASADSNFTAALAVPYAVAATNLRVYEERRRLKAPVLTTRLASVEEARVIVAPVVTQVATTSVAAYESAIVMIAQNGDSSFLDAEVKARTASGDLAGITRLLASVPAAVAQQ